MKIKEFISSNKELNERFLTLLGSPEKVNLELSYFYMRVFEDEKLQNCDNASLISCILDVFTTGATFDKLAQEVYLIENKNKCSVDYNYKFYLKILERNEMTSNVKCVYENDLFEGIDLDSGDVVKHVVRSLDRGGIIGAYCVIKWDKGIRVEILTRTQIDIIRDKANKYDRTGKKYYHAKTWDEFEDRMILKSIIYRTLNYVPLFEKNEQLKLALQTHEKQFQFENKSEAPPAFIPATATQTIAPTKTIENETLCDIENAINITTEEEVLNEK